MEDRAEEHMNLKHWVNARRSKGLSGAHTLPEVLVASVVLAVIGSAFCAGLSSGFLITEAAREDLRATQILMQKVEGLRLCTWSQLSSYTFREAYDPLDTNRVTGITYVGTVLTNAATNLPSVSYKTNMCIVTVSLRWTNFNGRVPIPHYREMQTQVARYGLQSYVWGVIR